jgi:hypothetical protein
MSVIFSNEIFVDKKNHPHYKSNYDEDEAGSTLFPTLKLWLLQLPPSFSRLSIRFAPL